MFKFDQSGAVTCKFTVGDLSNTWQQCTCPCPTGKKHVFKFDKSGCLFQGHCWCK